VQHEALLGFALECLKPLHVVAGTERGRNQRLGLATGKDCRAMSAGQHTNFNPDIPDLIECTAVWAALLIDYGLAENAFAQCFVVRLELGCSFVIVLRKRGLQFLLQFLD